MNKTPLTEFFLNNFRRMEKANEFLKVDVSRLAPSDYKIYGYEYGQDLFLKNIEERGYILCRFVSRIDPGKYIPIRSHEEIYQETAKNIGLRTIDFKIWTPENEVSSIDYLPEVQWNTIKESINYGISVPMDEAFVAFRKKLKPGYGNINHFNFGEPKNSCPYEDSSR